MANTAATITGVVQRHVNKAWQALPTRAFKTPLADPALAQEATLPLNSGDHMRFRRMLDFPVEDTLYTEQGEPASFATIDGNQFDVPIVELSMKTELGPMADKLDAINITKFATDQIMKWKTRSIHRRMAHTLVAGWTASVNGNSYTVPAHTSVYSNGRNSYADLRRGDTLRWDDIKRVVSQMRNSGVDGHDSLNGSYCAVIDQAVAQDLMSDDPKFRDAVYQHMPLLAAMDKSMDLDGFMWNDIWVKIQSTTDSYRTGFTAEAGAVGTYSATGAIHWSHIFGANAIGMLSLGSKSTRMNPKIKIQDITATGTNKTMGVRVPFNVVNFDTSDRKLGVALAATSQFEATL